MTYFSKAFSPLSFPVSIVCFPRAGVLFSFFERVPRIKKGSLHRVPLVCLAKQVVGRPTLDVLILHPF